MGKYNKRGNPKREFEHYTTMIRNTMETEAWRALSPTAQALYPWLKLEWKGVKFNNNGKIKLSVRQAANCIGVSPNTASKALHDLQAKGFIVVTERACLGVDGEATGFSYELTELAMPGGGNAGRKLYQQWRKGHDFPIVKANINNPYGREGKTKPHLKNSDRSVLEFKTKSK